MVDFNTLAGIIAFLFMAVIGHAGTTWYKLGRIEGKMDVICKQVQGNIEAIGELRNTKQNKK